MDQFILEDEDITFLRNVRSTYPPGNITSRKTRILKVYVDMRKTSEI
jgi:hypothetical protein